MSWTGKLSFEDLGSGAWYLETSDGKRFQLMGDIPSSLDGRKVVIEGTAVNTHGFAMAGGGKGIEVSSVKGA